MAGSHHPHIANDDFGRQSEKVFSVCREFGGELYEKDDASPAESERESGAFKKQSEK